MILFPRPGFALVLDDPTRPPVLGGLGLGISIGAEEEQERVIPRWRRKHANVLESTIPYRVARKTAGAVSASSLGSLSINQLDRINDSYLTKRRKKPRCD